MTYDFDRELAAGVAMLPTIDVSDLTTARAMITEMMAQVPVPDAGGVDVREERVPGPDGAPDVRVLVYTPQRRSGRGAVYDIHGGGFVVGTADIDHAANLTIARELGVLVVSVDYRLAPETPYPGGLEDCYAGLVWTVKNADTLGIDPEQVVVMGISAGGGLAAALALLARDRGGPAIAFSYLGVPEIDDRLTTPSMRQFVDTPLWNRPAAERSWDAYLGAGRRGGDDVAVYAAPARATDLSGLPPTYISVMQFDPLRDEGIAYAQALLATGIQVELHLFPGTFHGSASIAHAQVSLREKEEMLAVLARALGVER